MMFYYIFFKKILLRVVFILLFILRKYIYLIKKVPKQITNQNSTKSSLKKKNDRPWNKFRDVDKYVICLVFLSHLQNSHDFYLFMAYYLYYNIFSAFFFIVKPIKMAKC